MDNAACKIQATYRGHSVRQSLHTWQLPSGRTLYQTLEEAKRRAFVQDLYQEKPVRLTSDHYQPVRIPSVPPSPALSSVRQSSKQSSKGQSLKSPEMNINHSSSLSVANIISKALESSRLSLEDADRSLLSISKKKSDSTVCAIFSFPI